MIEHVKFEGVGQYYLLYHDKEKGQRSFFAFVDRFNKLNSEIHKGPAYHRELTDTAKTIGPKQFWGWSDE